MGRLIVQTRKGGISGFKLLVAFFLLVLVITYDGSFFNLKRKVSFAVFGAPDVLLITVDTLRADHLGAYGYGYAETPTIDDFALNGTTFHQAYVTTPRTTPGLASLHSGLWPHHHGSREVWDSLNEVPMMAALLRQAGYFTIGVTGNGSAAESQRFDAGFDLFGNAGFSDSDKVHEKIFPMLKEIPKDKPTFIWIHYYEPHFAYKVANNWKGKKKGAPCRQTFNRHGHSRGLYFSNFGGHAESVLEQCKMMYDGDIAQADQAIATFLGAYRKARGTHDSIVIFTADHGENFGEEDLFFEHGPNVHNASARIPLIVSGPHIKNNTDRTPISLEDVLPTLLDYLFISQDDFTFDGQSQLCRLTTHHTGECDAAKKYVFFESASSLALKNFTTVHSGKAGFTYCLNDSRFSLCQERTSIPRLYDHLADPHLKVDLSTEHREVYERLLSYRKLWRPEEIRQRAILGGGYKLTRDPLISGGYDERVYRIDNDPYNSENVIDSVPKGILGDLQHRLDKWSENLPDPAPRSKRDPAVLEALKALGYIE
jgi:arylsulfatase A-like enzyme